METRRITIMKLDLRLDLRSVSDPIPTRGGADLGVPTALTKLPVRMSMSTSVPMPAPVPVSAPLSTSLPTLH